VACWDDADYTAVEASAGAEPTSPDYVVSGFWTPREPQWINLAPSVCDGVQRLVDSHAPTAQNGEMLAIALHEAFHAHRIRSEAEATCDAVQVVPFAGRAIGLSESASSVLGGRALALIRASAAPGYWNPRLCRDGGAWDLLPSTRNLG
jgi:hypothetical protein